ncbi:hypothetical protein SAICODRAFT_63697 [Saitoella complicata NRRL Y-17804]|uniref:uncharacterized protein n=1 Tax=Saitoella complicata (strain BCRC 22490 / CBS 7301 / JCM 7358 / NBRC 10748 / NRRL Y-17804) TaxID=698492 RepID=UPI0008680AF7|nr:uncharacterized protein SAICODRAFT_63697 [Saitoella complicata NRRL Y-17804]ODQ55702.1 hypothetical protein SAICODRAFT_63697 [Saitoella complicata NRRL Y-17804]
MHARSKSAGPFTTTTPRTLGPPQSSSSASSSRDTSAVRRPPLTPSGSEPSLSSYGQPESSPSRIQDFPLSCPICNHSADTLQALNAHLDTDHAELPSSQKEGFRSWFEKNMGRARSFQTTMLQEKLRGLDSFDRAGSLAGLLAFDTPIPELTSMSASGGYGSCGTVVPSSTPNTDTDGKEYLYIDSASAVHRNHTESFVALRRKVVDKSYLELRRLEKRLHKLLSLLSTTYDHDPSPRISLLRTVTLSRTQQKALEQSVIKWEDDKAVVNCPICRSMFSFSRRKHHCRVCGRVVCGSPSTDCSSGVEFAVNGKDALSSPIILRVCHDCKKTLFGKNDFKNHSVTVAQCIKLYDNLLQYKRGIESMVPRFYEELDRMQAVRNLESNHDPPAGEALRLRRRLVDAFAQYDAISKRIRNLPAESLAQEKLQIAIHQMATQFMSVNLVPLQSVQRSAGTPLTTSQGAAVDEVQNTLSEDAETKLREQLMVLEEQRFLVQGMVEDAKRQRQLDEVATLTKSLEELDLEAQLTARKLAEGGIVII